MTTLPGNAELYPTWWHTPENQSYHVMVGTIWICNIELFNNRIIISEQANDEQ